MTVMIVGDGMREGGSVRTKFQLSVVRIQQVIIKVKNWEISEYIF